MVLVTSVELRGQQEILSGVLLDSFLQSAQIEGIFKAFLCSDRVREILCEQPKYEGGHGHTSEGQMVSKFTTQIHGECTYAREPPSFASILTEIIENRIELVTDVNLHDCFFPAFLALKPVPPPASTIVVVSMDDLRLGGFPDVKAFAEIEPFILKEPAINDTLKCGAILPVKCEIQGRGITGALKLIKQLSSAKFEALLFHEGDKGPVLEGSVLKKSVIQLRHASHSGQVDFSAKIGTVIRV